MNGLIESIKTGGYELLDSRIVQVLENEETVMSFGESSIIFAFEKSDSGEAAIKVESSEEKKIKFVLMNVTQPSYGTTEFVKFGKTNDEKDIYISFRVHSLNDKKVRSLEYSIYQK